ncbi:MAG: hypothetical protein ACJA2S_004263, partial [Cyclobacteriaceae bacterium]
VSMLTSSSPEADKKSIRSFISLIFIGRANYYFFDRSKLDN